MPNRIIKESICESLSLSESSIFVDDFYKRLITYADDYGRFNADPMIIVARLYPRELDVVGIEDVEDALCELSGNGKLSFYTSEAKKEVYGCFPNWGAHQRIRGAKKKLPEPDDTRINDWYLRRFIPADLKCKIIERDKYSCTICGKKIFSDEIPARKLIKMATGLFHIDHVVPVIQGGRATEENLRLTCKKCNQYRRKSFSFEEIVGFCNKTNQSASNCGNSPQIAANCPPNPIQSNTIQSNRNPIAREGENNDNRMSRAVNDYMNRINPEASPTSMMTLLDYERELGSDVCIRAFDIALDEKKTTWSYIHAILRDWKSKGIHCIADLNEMEKHREETKSPPANSRYNKKYKTIVDEDGYFVDVEVTDENGGEE